MRKPKSYNKLLLQTVSKKHSSTQVVLTEKTFFAAAFFEGLFVLIFTQIKKTTVYFGLNKFFHVPREGSSKEILFMRSKLSFLCSDI